MASSRWLGCALCLAALTAVVACACVRAEASGFRGGYKIAAPGYLGIMFHDVADSEVVPLRLKNRHGAEIVMVDHDGPAGKAGLREHDVVLNLNGTTVDGEEQLRRMLHDLPAGRQVSLYICRDGVERTVNATLATREDVEKKAMESRWFVPEPAPVRDEAVAPAPPAESSGMMKGFGRNFMPGHLLPMSPVYTGATVDAMGSQLADFFGVKDGKGLLVHEVDENSPAADAGLHAGDVVTRMNGSRVGAEKDWTRALHESKGRAVSLTVIRDRKEQTLTLIATGKKRSSVETPAMLDESPAMEPRPLVM